MFTKCVKMAVIVLAVFSLLTVAQAQTKATRTLSAPNIGNLQLTHPGNAGSLVRPDGGPNPLYGVGWNYVHPVACFAFYNSGYYFLVIYPAEGGYFYTTDANFQGLLEPSCQTGNLVAFDVYDNNLDWNAMLTFDYY